MMVKYKVSPKGLRRTVYQIHTNPFLLGCLSLLLLIGHSIID
jgi:predicted SPOUT superfamily RNA methylase MTH1